MANNYQNIVVAVDGSPEAHYAFRKSIDVAKRNPGSTIHLVNVIDTRSFAAVEAYDRSIAQRAKENSDKLLAGYKEEAAAEGVDQVNLIVEYGAPKNIITKELSNLVAADLIICGATGLNAVERFLIGSVSEAIVRSAKCDVLVIRTPEK